MSKKSKRQSYRTSQAQSLSGKADFNPDYSVIKHDLKRIGMIIGPFFVALIILSFFQDKILALFMK